MRNGEFDWRRPDVPWDQVVKELTVGHNIFAGLGKDWHEEN